MVKHLEDEYLFLNYLLIYFILFYFFNFYLIWFVYSLVEIVYPILRFGLYIWTNETPAMISKLYIPISDNI